MLHRQILSPVCTFSLLFANVYVWLTIFIVFLSSYLSKFLRKAFKDRNIPTEDFYAVPIVDKVENIYPIYERFVIALRFKIQVQR